MEHRFHAACDPYHETVSTRRPGDRTSQSSTVSLAVRIEQAGPSLTAAERRVAEVLLTGGSAVAFGTVAAVAQAAGSGVATVVRTAAKLGFDGFTELQAQARLEFAGERIPEADRVDRQGDDHLIHRSLQVELDNIRRSLEGFDVEHLDLVADDLSDLRHRIVIVAGEAAAGVGGSFARDLAALRPDVGYLVGNEVGIAAALAQYEPRDTLVVVGLRPYDRWLLEAVAQGDDQGLRRLVITDSVLSPLAGGAAHCFVAAASGEGPFDSYVGVLAVTNLIVASTARRLRHVAADRLGRAEVAWRRREARWSD
jgi:DNA-binding MurR/RpiR family transcriptional regulator